MFLPLNSGSIMLWPEKKSAPQPRVTHIATAAFGTLQNLDSSVECGTWRNCSLKPSLASSLWKASPVSLAGGELSANVRSGGPPHPAVAQPALFGEWCAGGMFAVGPHTQKKARAVSPPAAAGPPPSGRRARVA